MAELFGALSVLAYFIVGAWLVGTFGLFVGFALWAIIGFSVVAIFRRLTRRFEDHDSATHLQLDR